MRGYRMHQARCHVCRKRFRFGRGDCERASELRAALVGYSMRVRELER